MARTMKVDMSNDHLGGGDLPPYIVAQTLTTFIV